MSDDNELINTLARFAASADYIVQQYAKVHHILPEMEDSMSWAKWLNDLAARIENLAVSWPKDYPLTLHLDDVKIICEVARILPPLMARSLVSPKVENIEEEALAQMFAKDPEKLLRVWNRVGRLKTTHPLEVK